MSWEQVSDVKWLHFAPGCRAITGAFMLYASFSSLHRLHRLGAQYHVSFVFALTILKLTVYKRILPPFCRLLAASPLTFQNITLMTGDDERIIASCITRRDTDDSCLPSSSPTVMQRLPIPVLHTVVGVLRGGQRISSP